MNNISNCIWSSKSLSIIKDNLRLVCDIWEKEEIFKFYWCKKNKWIKLWK